MSVLLVAGAATAVVVGYLGHKSWLAFHRAVGISPGKPKYVDPNHIPTPNLVALPIELKQIEGLPSDINNQLQRIDNKATVYENWRQELEQKGKTPVMTEDAFAVSKLLNVRLPEMLDSYQWVASHESRLHSQDTSASPITKYHQVNSDTEATDLLRQLLNQTESKLDTLIERCQQESLQDMQVMRRYLDDR